MSSVSDWNGFRRRLNFTNPEFTEMSKEDLDAIALSHEEMQRHKNDQQRQLELDKMAQLHTGCNQSPSQRILSQQAALQRQYDQQAQSKQWAGMQNIFANAYANIPAEYLPLTPQTPMIMNPLPFWKKLACMLWHLDTPWRPMEDKYSAQQQRHCIRCLRIKSRRVDY